MKPLRRQGFALVATLSVLIVVTIVVVAFLTVMRTERSASQNYTDHSQTQSVALGLLNRIVAQHAAPVIDGDALAAFKVDPNTGIPTQKSAKMYYAASNWNATLGPVIPIPTDTDRKKLIPVYEINPDNEETMNETGLVRISRSNTGAAQTAYNADFWAYDGLTEKVLTDAGAPDPTIAQPAEIPQWVDYYESDASGKKNTYPTAQFAYAIWDEGGKIDINMAGADDLINGLAPHDLNLLKELGAGGTGTDLKDYLNGNDGIKQRNNFSLRTVVRQNDSTYSSKNDRGDDRWLFSVREMIVKNLIDPVKLRQVTATSRDFDMRPEWDGDRAPKDVRTKEGRSTTLAAEDYVKSYINNPNLFGMFFGAGGTGPQLVTSVLNTTTLRQKLQSLGSKLVPTPTSGTPAFDDWMQVMRLLAVLRRALPDYSSTTLSTNGLPEKWKWSPQDVWGVAQNILQASSTASDHNLVAYDSTTYSNPYSDMAARMGIRLSPYVTEVALKVKGTQNSNAFVIQEYIEIWNPYAIDLKYGNSSIKYRVGEWNGGEWPKGSGEGGFGAGGVWGFINTYSHVDNVDAPSPGNFKVLRMQEKTINRTDLSNQQPASANGLTLRFRPYIQDMSFYGPYSGDYFTSPESVYSSIMVAGFSNPGTGDDLPQLYAFIPADNLPSSGQVVWYSFQIDDPRMGAVRRNVNTKPSGTTSPFPTLSKAPGATYNSYGWMGYYNSHSLDTNSIYAWSSPNTRTSDGDVKTGWQGQTFSVNGGSVNGFNRNFGSNWPGSDGNTIDSKDFAKMMATFALPGRPFLNIGELGTVFAFRPWITLNFGDCIVPKALSETVFNEIQQSGSKAAASDMSKRPADFLDYYTTIGTTTADKDLRYLNSGRSKPVDKSSYTSNAITNNIVKRSQAKDWIFESVKYTGSGLNQTQIPTGNLRPIRGRINLNTANKEVLTTLLAAPYRMPASLGLKLIGGNLKVDENVYTNSTDYRVTINRSDAEDLAKAIALPTTDSKSIRPLRMLSDLSLLYDKNPTLMKRLYDTYPQSVISAMLGRLAQFGTVRTQSYTIDMVVRTLNPALEKRRAGGASLKSAITGETRVQARIFFDTFSRQAFVQSLQYR